MERNELIEHVWSFGFGGMEKSELMFMYEICQEKNVLELGCEVGQSSYIIASVAKSLICVDAWDDSYEHLNHDSIQKNVYLNDQVLHKDKEKNKTNIFSQFKRNCKEFIDSGKINYIKGLTQSVADNFENNKFDLILIDADHSYEGVYKDINCYLSKVNQDGLILFHDYGSGMWTGVEQACKQAVSENKLIFKEQFDRIGVFSVNQKFYE